MLRIAWLVRLSMRSVSSELFVSCSTDCSFPLSSDRSMNICFVLRLFSEISLFVDKVSSQYVICNGYSSRWHLLLVVSSA